MNSHEAVKILSRLAEGVDPNTGEQLPKDGIYDQPEVIRALFIAIEALQGSVATGQAPGHRSARTGEPWSVEEDEQLCSAFGNAVKFEEIATQHGRTKGAIVSRLMKLGKLNPRELPRE